MFKQLIIKNFQRHKELVVDFDKAITTIRGSTDSGKSSVVRALRWLCLNQPRGNDFLRRGAKEVSVTLKTDKHIIVRKRGTKSYYLLGEEGIPEKDWKEFTAFGTGVPDEIQQALKITDTNFQCQHDSAFWFSDSPADVSKQLNKIIDLSIIDTTLKNLNALVRQAKQTTAVTETRLQDAKDEHNGLKYVRRIRSDLEALELMEQDIAKNAERRALIDDITSNYTRLYAKGEKRLERLIDAEKVVESGTVYFDLLKKQEALSPLVSNILNSKEKLDAEIPPIDELEAQFSAIEKLKTQGHSLFAILDSIGNAVEEYEETDDLYQQKYEEFEKLKKERCPLCGQKPTS